MRHLISVLSALAVTVLAPLPQAQAGLIGMGLDGNLYDVNTTTGAVSNPRSTGFLFNEIVGLSIASNGTVYALRQGNASTAGLYTLNRATGAATMVGLLGVPLTGGDLAINPLNGAMFATRGPASGTVAGSSGTLLHLDPTTGAATTWAISSRRCLSSMVLPAAKATSRSPSIPPVCSTCLAARRLW